MEPKFELHEIRPEGAEQDAEYIRMRDVQLRLFNSAGQLFDALNMVNACYGDILSEKHRKIITELLSRIQHAA